MRIPWIEIHGGLGNQLFQWFYAHTIAENQNFRVHLSFPPSEKSEELVYRLTDLEANCSHCYNGGNESKSNKKYSPLFRFYNRAFHLSCLRSYLNKFGYSKELWDIRENPGFSFIGGKKKKFVSGFFQNQQILDRVKKEIKHELVPVIESLAEEVLAKLNLKPKNYSIAHIRKYPFSYGERISIGNLGKGYYESWANSHKHETLLLLCKLNSDAEFVRDIFPKSIVLTNEIIGPWETLALMSFAKELLSSNSTLSWWGAFLCFQNGGLPYLPDNWSCWGNIDIRCLQFEGSRTWQTEWDFSTHIDWTLLPLESR